VLSEWRGLPQAMPRPDRARPLGELVPEVLKNLGLGSRLDEAQVLGAWREIVGDFLAQHSEPARLRDGILFVRVLQPTVHYELDRVWKQEILRKMKERFGARVVRGVRFFVG
jgi:predicted nucleic acid-binding Zn ribbon protein